MISAVKSLATFSLSPTRPQPASGPRDRVEVGTTILPDNAGRIGALALSYGNKEFDDPLTPFFRDQVLGVYETLFQNMDPRTHFYVVAPDQESADQVRARAESSGMCDPSRVHVLNANSEKGFSIWMRDSMIPVRGPEGNPQLLVPNRRYWPGPEDDKVPYWIASMNPNIQAIPSPHLRVDGGNVLSDGTNIVIGADSIQETSQRTRDIIGEHEPPVADAKPLYDRAARQQLESALGKPALTIGMDDPATEPIEGQPIFHIDMGVTPLRSGETLLGDPQLAIRMLEALSPEEREQVNREMSLAAGLEPGRDLIGGLIELNRAPEIQGNFENAKRELLAGGHRVNDNSRLPCMFGSDVGQLPYITYNNCIQEDYFDETGNHIKKVYLPQFGCRPLDDFAREQYRSRGFDVVPLKMAGIAILEGAIRCSSHPLTRLDATPR